MKTMKLILMLTISTLFITKQANAQDQSIPKKFNKEISIDMKGLLFQNNQNANILLRLAKKKRAEKKIKGATRIGISTTFSTRENRTGFPLTVEANSNNLSLGLILGHEWQYNFGKFQFFYGLDNRIGGAYTNQNSIVNSNVRFARRYIAYAGLDVFLGLKYHPHPRISISLESAVSASFNYSKNNDNVSMYIAQTSKQLSALRLGYAF